MGSYVDNDGNIIDSDPEDPITNPNDPEPTDPDPEPIDPDPEPTDPDPSDPDPSDPDSSDPDPSDPDSSDPDPEPTDPEPNDPEPTDPEPTDPEPNDPEPNDPEPDDSDSDPEPTDPSESGNESGESLDEALKQLCDEFYTRGMKDSWEICRKLILDSPQGINDRVTRELFAGAAPKYVLLSKDIMEVKDIIEGYEKEQSEKFTRVSVGNIIKNKDSGELFVVTKIDGENYSGFGTSGEVRSDLNSKDFIRYMSESDSKLNVISEVIAKITELCKSEEV